MLRIESVILKSLFKSPEFVSKIYPFIKSEYFSESTDKIIFNQLQTYIDKYHTAPTTEAIVIQIDSDKSINEVQQQDSYELLEEITTDTENSDFQWVCDETEKWAKGRALYNAISASIGIAEGTDKKFSADAIPTLLQEALAVAFNTDVGHDYFEDSEQRFQKYHTKEDKIPFSGHNSILNYITNGGLPRGSITAFLAASGAGKSQILTSLAADYIRDGYDVLYITAEMSEHKICERIDAKLLDIDIHKIFSLNRKDFNSRMDGIKDKTQGRLIVKAYPTSSAHCGHFRQLLTELKHKKNFKPAVIVVDYMGIIASEKVKLGSSINSYTVLKSISEELRALAQEHNVVMITATQVNRSGQNNSDISAENIADSMGLLFVLDLLLAVVVDDSMEENSEMLFIQLKNRYSSTTLKRFRMKMDRAKMTFSDHPDTLAKINEFRNKIGAVPIGMPSGDMDEEIDEYGVITFGNHKKQNNFGGLNFE